MKRLLTGILLVLLSCAPALAAAQQQDVVGQAVTITLSNGSKISGTVTKRADGKVTLQADLIGEVVIEEKDIAGFGPAATPAPAQTTPTQAMTSTVKWSATGTAGYTYVSGAAPLLNVGDTHGVSLSLTTERTSPKDALSVSGSYSYQRTKPATAAANGGSATVAYNRQLNSALTLITRTTYAKDKVQRINRRFTNLNGLGFMPVKTTRATLSLVPGLGFTTTKYEVSEPALAPLFAGVKNTAFGYGIFEYLKFNILPTLSIQQTFMHLRAFERSSQYVSEGMVSLVGLISPRVGLSISYTYNYDSQLPEPYIKRRTGSLTSGIQIKF